MHHGLGALRVAVTLPPVILNVAAAIYTAVS